MKPVDQQVLHDPDNGKYGDCMRACIASLLELPAEEVPHFFKTGNDNDFDDKLDQYLRWQGYSLLDITYFEFGRYQGIRGETDIHHIISGYTERGTYHATVGHRGKVVHDPHPSKAGLSSDKEDWIFSFLIKTKEPK